MGASRKFHNVAENGAVAFVVDDLASREPWTVRGVEIRGRAEALVDQETGPTYASLEVIRIHPAGDQLGPGRRSQDERPKRT
jgi:pyridoxamine 5'-phosphate oxidase family protein